MRRDTQIGIILGVVILIIIGVFVGTRSTLKEPQIPDTTLTENTETSETEIKEIGIDELIRETTIETITPDANEQEISIKEEYVPETGIETETETEEETIIHGQWEGTTTETDESGEIIAQTITAEEEVEEQQAEEEEEAVEEILMTEADEQLQEQEQETQTLTITTTTEKTKTVIHKVVQDDNLSKISKQYYNNASKWKIIYDANKGILRSPDSLKIGMELLIPDLAIVEETKKEAEKKKKKSDKKEPSDTASEQKITEEKPSAEGTHAVRKGDSLFKLARKYYGDEKMWYKIYDANLATIPNKHSLKIGQVLFIPK